MPNYKEMSMLDCAENILRDNNGPMNISEILNKVLELKEITDEENDIRTQLYTDMVLSSKFVYMGESNFNLKELESLEQYEKDSSSFVVATDEEIEEEITVDYEEEDEDDDFEDDEFEDDEFEDDEDEDSQVDLEDDPTFEHDEDGNLLERYNEDNDFDEDKYNTYMDDYEDIYND